jgi:heterodisulfide reductase subunit A-like polyferredoxin
MVLLNMLDVMTSGSRPVKGGRAAVVTAPETVVVGGGVLGASSAYFLARAGTQMVLVEKAHVGATVRRQRALVRDRRRRTRR